MARPVNEKSFANMLRIALEADGPGVRLRKIAEQVTVQAMNGEQWAVKEVADRLDGKPAQAIVGDSERDPIRMVQEIRETLIDPSARHSDGEGVQAASDARPL